MRPILVPYLLDRVYSWFYSAINVGSATSQLATPWLLAGCAFGALKLCANSATAWGFGVPGILMAAALAIYLAGRRSYVKVPPAGRDPNGFLAVLRTRLFGGEDAARRRHGEGAVEGMRSVFRIALVFLPIVAFWALYFQYGSSWFNQAEKMDRDIFGWHMESAQMESLNAILILVMVPTFAYAVYPALERAGIRMTMLRRMAIGMFFAVPAFLSAAMIQRWIEAGAHPHIAWQVIQYVLISIAETMVSVTALEFAYTQAPRSLKGVIMSLWFLTLGTGNFVTSLVRSKVGGMAQEWIVAAGRTERAPDIVALQAEGVAETMRIERPGDPARHQLVLGQPRDRHLPEDAGNLPVRFVVQLFVRHADAHLRAETLLHRLHAGDQLGERARRRAAPLHPGARDVRTVPGEAGAGVDEQRLRRQRALRVAHVVQRRGVLSQRDDVLVRRLGVVLASGAEEGEMQLELAPVGALEQPPQLLVPERRPPVRLREALHFVRGLVRAQPIERAHERGRVHVRDLQLRRGARIVSDEGHSAGRKRRDRLHNLQRRPEMIALRWSGRFPVALHRRTEQNRLPPRHHQEQASPVREGKPVLEVRRRSQRPVLVVGVRPLQRRAGMNGERAESRLLQRRRDVPRQFPYVFSMQIRKIHGDYAF